MKNIYLCTDVGDFALKLDENSSICADILSELQISGNAKNIGGEIFYIIDLNIPFDGSEEEVFEVGDVVYWRAQKEDKFAIAIFYGNTKFGDGNAPRAASPCIKFASIEGSCSKLKNVESGSTIFIKQH